MAEHNQLGKQGENIALEYLEQQGFEIIHTNWRIGHIEVDIIAVKDNILAFVEVKTRSTAKFGEPQLFVNRTKQRAYIKAANAYVNMHNRSEEVRFDIVAIVKSGNDFNVTYIPHAYSTIL